MLFFSSQLRGGTRVPDLLWSGYDSLFFLIGFALFMLFGKKKKNSTPPPPPTVDRIVTMPEIFYGGADPTIYPTKNAPAEQVLTTTPRGPIPPVPRVGASPTPAAPQLMAEEVPTGRPEPKNAVTWVVSHRIRAIGIFAAIFLAFLALVTWYYVRHQTPSTPIVPKVTDTTVVPVVTPIVTPSVATTTVVSVTTTPVPATSTPPVATIPSGDSSLTFPPLFLVDTPDLDRDSLTDAEEEIFGTDPGVWDTDSDGYYDGQELMNLYNPRGLAPIRLVDSGLVKEYASSRFAYRLYYPASWLVAPVDTSERQVVVSAPNGEFFTVTVSDKIAGESFTSWFARAATHEQFSDVQPMKNRFGISLFRRKDGLVYYDDTASSVIVFAYSAPTTGTAISYRHVFGMMAQSFRPNDMARVLPDELPIPPVPSTTVTSR